MAAPPPAIRAWRRDTMRWTATVGLGDQDAELVGAIGHGWIPFDQACASSGRPGGRPGAVNGTEQERWRSGPNRATLVAGR